MTYYRIWVPSKQKYIRFKEINIEQYRNILKTIDDDWDFEYSINNLLVSNCCESNFNIKDLTIIDRFVIVLQLKIHSCGARLDLIRVCDKCETKTKFSINLNDLIEELATKIDKSFEKQYLVGSFHILCDVPFVDDDILQLDKNNLNERLDFYLYSFIKKIVVKEKIIDLYDLPLNSRIDLCNNLPLSCVKYIKDSFVNQIHSIFSDLLIKETECSNKSCNDILSIKLDITSLTDVIKLLFRDSSNTNILAQYVNLGMNCHFDFEFYKNICPAELNIIENLVKNSQKTEEDDKKTNNDINLFEQYKMSDTEVLETPSEFK